ncbi:MAG: hypothetical protein HYW49_03120 [Deltaproteobacteria bacterium]|nr:hypothetical protein [Deltaproteobacteria bacterium]
MAIHFKYTSHFDESRFRIEQHLYDSVLDIEKDIGLAIRSVDQFAKAIDRLLDTLEQMYQTPNPKDSIGEKSFPIREGRYRIFFKVTVMANNDFDITLLDVDDNKQSNLDRFPSHGMISFDDEG